MFVGYKRTVSLFIYVNITTKILIMSKKDLRKFGKKLKSLRLANNLTQLELAEILEMSPNFIGMIERGERNTTVENVYNIARALKIQPSILFEEL